jgi:ABC-type sulfate transport system permease subunit
MATDGLRLSARPRASSSTARRTWPIGRWLLIAAVLGWFGVLVLVPSLALLRQVLAGGLRPFITMLSRPEFVRPFGLSLGITALATLVNTVFGIALALVLVRHKFWGRALLDGVVDLPFAVSPSPSSSANWSRSFASWATSTNRRLTRWARVAGAPSGA